MNALQEFKFNENQVRVVMINNEPWWVLSDVCGVLGIGNPSMVSLDKDEVRTLRITEGGPERRIVNESGLYAVIMRSNKPEAKAFSRWVRSEVLPQIRKTGSYSFPTDPHDQVIMLCEKLYAMALEAKQLTLKIAEQQPAVNFYNSVSKAANLQSIRQVAKEIGTGEKKLFAMLRETKVLMGNNLPYQNYIDQGYFEVKCRDIKMGDQVVAYSQTFVTVKGLEWINKHYGKQVAA